MKTNATVPAEPQETKLASSETSVIEPKQVKKGRPKKESANKA